MAHISHKMRKEGLKNLTLTGHTEGNWDKRKEHATCLMRLCNRMAEQGLGRIRGKKTLLSEDS